MPYSEDHDLVGAGSEYFLKKCIIEANSPKEAIENRVAKMVNEEFGKPPHEESDECDIEEFIDDIRGDGASVIELANNKVKYFER